MILIEVIRNSHLQGDLTRPVDHVLHVIGPRVLVADRSEILTIHSPAGISGAGGESDGPYLAIVKVSACRHTYNHNEFFDRINLFAALFEVVDLKVHMIGELLSMEDAKPRRVDLADHASILQLAVSANARATPATA